MAIPFESLGQVLTTFDNDMILSITEYQGATPRAENVPCHLSITQADNPASAQMQGGAKLPIVMYGKIYFSQDVIIAANDVISVEKHASDGTLLATYSGKCGVPSVRQGRREAVFEITAVTQPTPPPTGTFGVEIYYGLDNYGTEIWDTGDYNVTAFDRDGYTYITFDDGWIFRNNKVYYIHVDGYGQNQTQTGMTVNAGTVMKRASTEERFEVVSAPTDEGGLIGWTAKIEWRN